jgi:hypothetical protein
MSSSEDIRKTIVMLESIQQGKQLDEGFSLNLLDLEVGGVTISSIIKDATDSMTPEQKRDWVVRFLEGFFGAGELAEFGKHLVAKHGSNQVDEGIGDIKIGGTTLGEIFRNETKDMSQDDKINWLTQAIESVATTAEAVMIGKELTDGNDKK